jgi:hypothetical protein
MIYSIHKTTTVLSRPTEVLEGTNPKHVDFPHTRHTIFSTVS